MKNTRAVLRALPLVASALGSKYGVRVVIGGNQACTDGRTITLPSLPLDMPETFLLLVRGYLDHEAGHIRETDFDALRGARLSPLEHHVWNSIEDWRVERRMAEIFPGCRHNFNRLVRHVFAGSATVSGSPVQDIPNWLLLAIRSWDVPELAVSRDELARHMDREFPGLRARLESALHAVRALCRSTGDALDYARRIVRLLEQAAQPQPASRAPGRQKSPRDVSTPGQKAEAGQAADQKEDSPAPVALPDSNPETDRRQAIAAGGTRRKGLPAKAAKRLKALLDAPGDALPGNLGSVLAQAITEAAPGDGKDALRVAVVGHKPLLPLSEQERKDALRASTALQARLHGLLQASTLVRCATGRRGRLDTGRLHRLAVDDTPGSSAARACVRAWTARCICSWIAPAPWTRAWNWPVPPATPWPGPWRPAPSTLVSAPSRQALGKTAPGLRWHPWCGMGNGYIRTWPCEPTGALRWPRPCGGPWGPCSHYPNAAS
jgi:hypothetical protein